MFPPLTHYSKLITVVDPAGRPGGPGSPLFLEQTEAQRAFVGGGTPPPPFSKGMDDRLPYLKDWTQHWKKTNWRLLCAV